MEQVGTIEACKCVVKVGQVAVGRWTAWVWQFRSGNRAKVQTARLGGLAGEARGLGWGVANAAEATVSQSALGSGRGGWAWTPQGSRRM